MSRFSLKFFYRSKSRAVFFSSVFATLAVITLLVTILSSPNNIVDNTNTPPYRTPVRNGVTSYAVINMGSEPITLNSLKASDPASKNILRHVMEGLVRLDKNGKPVPGVAESWEVSDNNLIWTFKLRKNSFWTDGKHVTAHDFVFAFENLLMGNGAPEYQEQMKIFKNAASFLNGKSKITDVGFSAKDDGTLVLTLERPEPNLLIMLSDTQFAPVNKNFYEQYSTKYGVEPYTISYNGPWYLREWTHNERVVLVRNNYYWNYNSIYIEQVLFISSGTTESKIFRLQKNDYDFVYVPAYELEDYINEDFEPESFNDGAVVYLEFNTKDSVMSNVHLRKALAYGIDREKLVKETVKNGSTAAYSLINPKAFYNNLGDFKIEKSNFSDYTATKDLLAEAKAELALAKKELKNDQINSIKITVDESKASITYANALVKQWKENLGLNVTVESLSYSDRVTKIQNNDYKILVNYWDIPYPSLENVLKLFEKQNNFSNYDREDFYKKLDSIYEEKNITAKNALIEEAFAALKNDVPVAPLYYRNKSFISTGRIKNIIVDAYRDIDLYYAN